MDKHLQNFQNDVVLKYRLYNGLFLTLPFGETEETGALLTVFSKYCHQAIQEHRSPADIVQAFFKENNHWLEEHDQIELLFKMLQFIERQVVLFDAVEDAAFAATHQLKGPGSLSDLIAKTLHKQRETQFVKVVPDYQFRLVLTAHPTQFYSDPILIILTQLVRAFQGDNLKQISLLLLQMGKTSFKHRHKPTPYQEARSIVWYLEHVFYHVIPQLQSKIEQTIQAFDPMIDRSFQAVELGFWPGGDRDGNPFVTAEVTLQVARLLKFTILRLYAADLHDLTKKLTFEGVLSPLEKIKFKLEQTLLYAQLSTQNPNCTLEGYAQVEALLTDLLQLKQLLIEEHNALFLPALEKFIGKVQCFGFYFSPMDIRENASVHRDLISLMMQHCAIDYVNHSDNEKIADLQVLVNDKTLLHRQFNTQTCVETIRAIKTIQIENGAKGLCRYVISNTHSALNVLELFTLLQVFGGFSETMPVDIIPLFESIEDLENAATIMESLYQNTHYQQHLQHRGAQQTIMLGFSDGTKDGGYVTANWSIYKAKVNLTAISQKYKINVSFFDGRGGPPARGGGNTHNFYCSLGQKIDHRQIQLTVQGQTISVNFGNRASAKYNLEQLYTAGLKDLIFPEESNDLTESQWDLLEQLSQNSHQAYLDLKNNPLFIPYLLDVTPLPFFNELNIGSRPASRKKSQTFQLNDLRAIPFVGSWSQIKQNIPGYFGFGTALQQLIQVGQLENLKQLYQSSLFFRTLVENTMMSLSKTCFELTQYLANDKRYGTFWQTLRTEAELTKTLLLDIAQQRFLLENDPLIRESIQLREEIVLPLLMIQQFATLRWHELADKNENQANIYRKMILKALAANTNASRNSA
ncbi:MAG: phosphoenolpyruvate carboxylase [Gammaproteobacteria bacterium]